MLGEQSDIDHDVFADLVRGDVAVTNPAPNNVVVVIHANPVRELAPRHHRRWCQKVFQREVDSFPIHGLSCTMLVYVGQ